MIRKREDRTGAWHGDLLVLRVEIDFRVTVHDVRSSGNRQKIREQEIWCLGVVQHKYVVTWMGGVKERTIDKKGRNKCNLG